MIDKPLHANSLPVYVLCNYDVPCGTVYDVVFDAVHREHHEATQAEVLFGILMKKIVESTLGQGWHQTAMLHCPTGEPELFKQLGADEVSCDVDSGYLGLCLSTDFPEVQRGLASPAN